VLSVALGVAGVWGPEVWTYELVAGVSIRAVMVGWMTTTILFGAARSLVRVARTTGAASAAPIAAFIGLSALIVAAAAADRVPWWSALLAGAALDVFYGMRMLALRFAQRFPRLEAIVVAGAVLTTAVLVMGHFVPETDRGPAAMLALTAVLVVLTLRETRRALAHLRALSLALIAGAVTLLLSGASPAQAQAACRAVESVTPPATRTPVPLRALRAAAPIERLTFATKDPPLLVSGGRACPDSPEGALVFLEPITTAVAGREWMVTFEPDQILDRVGPVLAALGARPIIKPRGVTVAAGAACASLLVEREGRLRAVWRCRSLQTGVAVDQLLGELVPPPELVASLESSGRRRAPVDPALRARYLEQVEGVRRAASSGAMPRGN
jgi:hypothetical protein